MRSNPATTPDLPTACPSCGAAVRSRLSWCSLCFASLEPAEPASITTEVTAPAPDDDADGAAPGSSVSSSAPLTVPLTMPLTMPLTDAGLAELDAVASRLLAQLAAQQGQLPGAGLPGGRAARTGLVVVSGLCGCGLLVGVLAVLGLFL